MSNFGRGIKKAHQAKLPNEINLRKKHIKQEIICLFSSNFEKKVIKYVHECSIGGNKYMRINWPKMILRLRAKLNISQEELGKLIDVSLASVSRWERGEHEPTAIAKIKLEDFFKENNIEFEEVE